MIDWDAMPWLTPSAMEHVVRIDVGLEGAWSESVRPVWDAERGPLPIPSELPGGPGLVPSLELYFDGGWIGIHCYRRVDGAMALDREAVAEWVREIEGFKRPDRS